MSNHRRVISPTGIYHVMSRGNNKNKIYENESDKKKLLKYFKRIADSNEVIILAYCIMPNHYHLLVQEMPDEPQAIPDGAIVQSEPGTGGTGAIVQSVPGSNCTGGVSHGIHRLNTAYSHYYVMKYGHVGHAFQGRYRSKAIDSVDYLARVIRYIHQNPVKAGMTETAAEYVYSSYGEFLGKQKFRIIPENCAELLQAMGFQDQAAFRDYHLKQDAGSLKDDFYLFEEEADLKLDELEFAQALKAGIPEFEALSPWERMEFAKSLMERTSRLSKMKIAEIAGVSRNRLVARRKSVSLEAYQAEDIQG